MASSKTTIHPFPGKRPSKGLTAMARTLLLILVYMLFTRGAAAYGGAPEKIDYFPAYDTCVGCDIPSGVKFDWGEYENSATTKKPPDHPEEEITTPPACDVCELAPGVAVEIGVRGLK